MDNQPRQRRSTLRFILAAACLGLFSLTGCENDETTKAREVEQKVIQARSAMETNSPEAAEMARKAFREASELSKDAAPAARIEAKASFAHSSYSAAVDKMPEVTDAEVRANRALRDLLRLASNIATNNAQIDYYKGGDPAANGADPIKGFAAAQADFQARAGKLDAELKKITSERQALEQGIQAADAKRAESIRQANTLAERSDQTQGQESVNLFKQSAAARAAAGLLSNEIDLGKMKIVQLQARAADLTRQIEILAAASKSMETQVTEMKNSWANTQEKIAARQAASKTLLDQQDEKDKGIAALAREFAEARDQAAAARKICLDDYLDAAIASYEEAAATAGTYTAELQRMSTDAKASGVAFLRLKQVYDPMFLKLGQARALYTRGSLYLQERNLLDAQHNALTKVLDPVFKQAGLTVPPELAAPNFDEQIKKANEDAERDLLAAKELIDDVVDRSPDPDRDPFKMKDEAYGLQAAVEFTLYRLNNKTEHLALASAAVKALDEGGGVTFPALPPGLERSGRARSAPAGGTGSGTRAPTGRAPAGRTPAVESEETPATVPSDTPTPDAGAPGKSGGWSSVLKRVTGARGGAQGDQPAPPDQPAPTEPQGDAPPPN